ncbi:MAG: response regulator transcription factor [Firmicutes bacterium]|nr:response regulator transcription factor [Bacillota bacterium]
MKKILIIEDDESIAEIEKDYLEMSGYAVEVCYDGERGLARYNDGGIDLVILDIMIPKPDGFEILGKIGESKKIPVIIISAKDEEVAKIKGLNSGADDYITKPFGMGELLVRVKSHLKTYEKLSASQKSSVITVRGISVNEAERRVYVDCEEIMLKQKEFDLLLFLMKNPNRVYSKEDLFERVWGFDALSDASTVTVHIARIREKIEKNPARPEYITTVWGAGYRFEK